MYGTRDRQLSALDRTRGGITWEYAKSACGQWTACSIENRQHLRGDCQLLASAMKRPPAHHEVLLCVAIKTSQTEHSIRTGSNLELHERCEDHAWNEMLLTQALESSTLRTITTPFITTNCAQLSGAHPATTLLNSPTIAWDTDNFTSTYRLLSNDPHLQPDNASSADFLLQGNASRKSKAESQSVSDKEKTCPFACEQHSHTCERGLMRERMARLSKTRSFAGILQAPGETTVRDMHEITRAWIQVIGSPFTDTYA